MCVAIVTSKHLEAYILFSKMDALLASFNAASVPKAPVYRSSLYAFDLHAPLKVKEVSPYISGQGECLKCIVEDHDGNLFHTYFGDENKIYYSNSVACEQFKQFYDKGEALYVVPYVVERKRSVFFVGNGEYNSYCVMKLCLCCDMSGDM